MQRSVALVTLRWLSKRRLDRVPGGFGVVAAPGRRGPPEGAVRELIHGPPGLLLESVVVPTLRAPVAEAGPSARFVRRVVLKVAVPRGPAADRAGAGRVPDLGQVPQLDAGIVAPGFVTVLAVLGVEGVDRDDQARPAARNAQPPGAVPARRAVPAGRGKGEPGPVRWRARARRDSCCPWVQAGRSRGRWRGRARRSPSRTTSSAGSARRRRGDRGPARGRPGPARRARRAGPPGRPRCPAGRSA